jgi:putative heme-binding domain-containing protein
MQMAALDEIPVEGVPLLVRAARNPTANAGVLAQAVAALAKTDSVEGARAMLAALVSLNDRKGVGKESDSARQAFLNAPKLDVMHAVFEAEAAHVGTPSAIWAEGALLKISSRASGSPEARELAAKTLATGWETPARRIQIIKAADKFKLHAFDQKILAAVNDADADVVKAAKSAVTSLRLGAKGAGGGPLVGTLSVDDAVAQVVKMKGDAGLGEQIFLRQTCMACHSVSQTEMQKGPYLGNIAQTYPRPELARNILNPNLTIAQGFATEIVKLKDGSQQVGFITLEAADRVKLRNVAAQEFTFLVKDIAERQRLPISVMPAGLVDGLTIREFASLLDYLEALAKK